MCSKSVLVTGGNGVIGQAIGRAFLESSEGSLVWLGVRQNQERAAALKAEFPERCRLTDLDATRPSDWRRAVDGVLAEHGTLDVLVNNAGGHEDALLAQMPLESWRRVLDLNLDGVFHGCQAVLPAMISQKNGRIVNIASLSALLAPPGQTNYAAAKAGVTGLTQSLAKEVARLGVTVNAICPGYIETPEFEAMEASEKKALLQKIPMRRLGKPREVAALTVFLASSQASYLTGAAIKLDGGIF